MPRLTPSLEAISDERKQATMAASRLEADILQAIIKHAQEHHTPVDTIILALSNCTTHWVNHLVNGNISRMLYNELNNEKHFDRGQLEKVRELMGNN